MNLIIKSLTTPTKALLKRKQSVTKRNSSLINTRYNDYAKRLHRLDYLDILAIVALYSL
jgi:hypothetical protein